MALSVDNCTAFDILEELGYELDLMYGARHRKWRCYFTQKAYDKVKVEGFTYEKEGEEYIVVIHNEVTNFIIHMRFAGIDNAIPEKMPHGLGCRRQLDDE